MALAFVFCTESFEGCGDVLPATGSLASFFHLLRVAKNTFCFSPMRWRWLPHLRLGIQARHPLREARADFRHGSVEPQRFTDRTGFVWVCLNNQTSSRDQDAVSTSRLLYKQTKDRLGWLKNKKKFSNQTLQNHSRSEPRARLRASSAPRRTVPQQKASRKYKWLRKKNDG